ncbi:MAG: chemotaxis protein [Peptococcaceae bacterium]|jgi:two-component system chemotaxis response regulator CheV|nr:chemotaxis protein [Peptococcaceae bacterium]
MSQILQESGTGEVEFLEFVVNGKSYAINVIKVKEVLHISPKDLRKVPLSDPAIAGLLLSRSRVIPAIDLSYVIDGSPAKESTEVVICEFNKLTVAFIIDDFTHIHRIRWDAISKSFDSSASSLLIGVALINEKIISLLDFEKIITDIAPDTGISEKMLIEADSLDRSYIKVALADDSILIRKLLNETLSKAGYTDLRIFDDGQQLLDYLLNLVAQKGADFLEDVQLVVTDIEMPMMDGHTLTRRIKEHPLLKKLPVIIFSSLITNDLKHKGESVGADAQLSKPEINELISTIDRFLATS